MDTTFQTEQGTFNYRVCAILISEGRLLVMRDEGAPYEYLPGGRVNLHETAEDAIVREMKEELGIDAEIVRPLWLNQSFFIESVSAERYHELCLFFLVDAPKTDLARRGERFTRVEGKHTHAFAWIPFEELEGRTLYPAFIKSEIFHLPRALTLRAEKEY